MPLLPSGTRPLLLTWSCLACLCLGTFVASLCFGSTAFTSSALYDALFQRGDAAAITILWDLRMPRAVAACLVGAGLAVAGSAYQALFRNALADPYIIGASGGATVGASLMIVLGSSFTIGAYSPASAGAFVGSFVTVAFVYITASVGRWPSTSLLLFGVIVGMMLSGLVWLMLALADAQLSRIVSWLMGGFGSANWATTLGVLPLIVISSIVLYLLARPLDALAQGDDEARSLGLSVFQITLVVLLACSVIVSSAVAMSGSIGFVGLAAPQAARLLVGGAHARVLPTAALLGAMLLLLADLIARTVIAPLELPVGVVTSLVGGPLFVLLLRQQSRSEAS